MQKLKIKLEDNPFFSSPEMTTLTNGVGAASRAHFGVNKYRHLFNNHADVSYISLLLGYGQKITATTDLFKFIDFESINELRNGRTVLIFDATLEGYSETELPLKTCLYYNAILHNINPSKIFLFTGNFLTADDNINVIPIFLLDTGWHNIPTPATINDATAECFKNLEKIILSLSRRNRFPRVVAHFALWKSQLNQDSIISQDIVSTTATLSADVLKKLDLTIEDWNEFKSVLPLLADGNNFHINAPFDHLPDLHSKTVFSIVNETLISDYNNTSLFFSEKLLKPIINYQPMVIYGQPCINRKIQMLGFKTYDDYFDLSFDDEPDDILRYKKLLASVESTVNHLKSLSRDEQIAWRFKELELLIYNREVFLRKENNMKQLELFSEKLTSIFQTKS